MILQRLIGLVCVILPGVGALPLAGELDSCKWVFDVYVDDRYIGEHFFELSAGDEQLVLSTVAQFEYKILFFSAFRYEHKNTEVWDRQGLLAIDAFTDSNGKEFLVRGERTADGFALTTYESEQDLPAGLKTFAYWNPSILDEERLLNSQTGEYVFVDVVNRGMEVVEYQGSELEAIRYDLVLSEGPISIWYGKDDQRWLALESETGGGRLLKYVPKKLPLADSLPQLGLL